MYPRRGLKSIGREARPLSHVAVGLALGFSVGVIGIWSMVPARSEGAERAVTDGILQVYHKQPSLVESGKPLELVFDTVCPWDEEAFMKNEPFGCSVAGEVFVSADGSEEVTGLQLDPADGTPFLTVTVPPEITSHGFTYYAELAIDGDDDVVRVPDDPGVSYRAWPLETSFEVMLERPTTFDSPDATVVFGQWGRELGQFGLSGGNESGLDGPSSFGFDKNGRLFVMDQVNRRLVRFDQFGTVDRTIPIDHSGSLGDLAIGAEGTLYVMDDSARAEARVVALDAEGRILATMAPPATLPEKMSVVDGKLFVLDAVQGSWAAAMDHSQLMPIGNRTNGLPLGLTERAAASLRLDLAGDLDESDSVELVAWADINEAKFALVAGSDVVSSWSISSQREIGEIQLAQMIDGDLVVVLRTWDEETSAFEILRISGSAVVMHRVADAGDWAEASVLGRFELNAQGSLFQLRSNPDGFSIVRYDIGGGE